MATRLEKKFMLSTSLIVIGVCAVYTVGNNYDELNLPKRTVTVENDMSYANIATNKSNNERGYIYSTLTTEEQVVYDEIYELIMSHGETCTVSTKDSDMLNKAYKAVICDNGNIFWVAGYDYREQFLLKMQNIEFSPSYTMDLNKREMYQICVDQEVEYILQNIETHQTDYEKAKYIFEYLAQNVEYNLEAPENQNILSVFLNYSTVCQGYAKATQYLLDEVGIESAVVTGNIGSEDHSWNLVKLDGDYYYIDTTWGNSTYASSGNTLEQFVNYNYFAVTSEELERTHTPNNTFTWPECTAIEDNYYVKEGLYIDNWNADEVGSIINRYYMEGEDIIALKFSDSEIYRNATQYLLSEEQILNYCTGVDSLYYVADDIQNCIIINIFY